MPTGLDTKYSGQLSMPLRSPRSLCPVGEKLHGRLGPLVKFDVIPLNPAPAQNWTPVLNGGMRATQS
jgi:hypothetical protein